MRPARLLLVSCLLLQLLTACGDTESEFSRLRAFCRITPVTAATPLHEALNNPGMFCTLTQSSSQYVFTRQNGTSIPMDITAMSQNYLQLRSIYNMGFIIGTPSVPNFAGNFYFVAFDIVCPNCYEGSIAKTLTLKGERADCSRCRRSYDLQNRGIVCEGDKGRKLHRYKISYQVTSNLMIIDN